MPGLNDQTVWQKGATGAAEREPFGDCAKFSVVDAGADDAWVRRFTAPGDLSAAQLIAVFADAKSAWRGEQVLRGWHRDCRDQLNAPVEKVGSISAGQVSQGEAFSYLVQWGEKDAESHHFNGVAVNRVGAKISVVLVDTKSQDYNYEVGQAPADRAARLVANKLR